MEIGTTISDELVNDIFKRIRESEELGRGSCSNVDECLDDHELRERIVEEIIENPIATVEEIFQSFLATEKIQRDYEADIQGA